MPEYVRYKGIETKIGVVESLFYVSYQKYTAALAEGYLQRVDKSLLPERYAEKGAGFIFRFPFPDEDHRKFGDVDDHNRSIPITITDPLLLENSNYDKSQPYKKVIGLESQKLILRDGDKKECLAAVFSQKEDHKLNVFSVGGDSTILKIVGQFMKNNVEPELDPVRKNLYNEVAKRILDGYQLEIPKLKIQPPHRLSSKAEDKVKGHLKIKRGKGL
jgi:hypothetical protein